jgi:hypothetical protein
MAVALLDKDPLLALMNDDMYHNVSQQSGKAVWLVVLDWLEQSFAETSVGGEPCCGRW